MAARAILRRIRQHHAAQLQPGSALPLTLPLALTLTLTPTPTPTPPLTQTQPPFFGELDNTTLLNYNQTLLKRHKKLQPGHALTITPALALTLTPTLIRTRTLTPDRFLGELDNTTLLN